MKQHGNRLGACPGRSLFRMRLPRSSLVRLSVPKPPALRHSTTAPNARSGCELCAAMLCSNLNERRRIILTSSPSMEAETGKPSLSRSAHWCSSPGRQRSRTKRSMSSGSVLRCNRRIAVHVDRPRLLRCGHVQIVLHGATLRSPDEPQRGQGNFVAEFSRYYGQSLQPGSQRNVVSYWSEKSGLCWNTRAIAAKLRRKPLREKRPKG
jgi:hypothetical protein